MSMNPWVMPQCRAGGQNLGYPNKVVYCPNKVVYCSLFGVVGWCKGVV